jgi:hypothetical protein
MILDSPAQTEHVRQLLGQRQARSNAHDRWPSATSDASDSPSLYSHPAFSPRPPPTLPMTPTTPTTPAYPAHYQHQHQQHPHDVRFPQLIAIPRPRSRAAAGPGSPLSDRERLEDPALSGLDLSDDPRASLFTTASRTSSDGDGDGGEGSPDSALLAVDESDGGLASHMSFLGPKMKFHSPAPWELSDDTDADSDGSTQTRTAGSGSGGGGFIKGLGFAPRTSTERDGRGRPSAESARSKKSSDASHGALQ